MRLFARYEQPFSLAIFDIDHFKHINDVQGHVRGDQILQTVARMLDDATRDTDLVARYGGEEFVIVMPQTEADGAAAYADRIRGAIEQLGLITISGGVATASEQDDPKTLLRGRRRSLCCQGGWAKPHLPQHGHQRRTLAGRHAGNGSPGGRARKAARLASELFLAAPAQRIRKVAVQGRREVRDKRVHGLVQPFDRAGGRATC